MINFCFEVVSFLFQISPFLLLTDLPRPKEPGKKKACLLLPSGVHFLAQKKGD